MTSKTFDKEYLGLGGFVWFFGVVEDIMDPLKVGRVRVRCYDWHPSDKSLLPTDQIPWAQVMMPANNPSVSGVGTSPNGLKQGSWVMGFFLDGQQAQRPFVMGSIPAIPSHKADENNKNKGFNDPEGRYPTVAHEPDTNRLARNDANNAHGVIASKNSGRSLTVPIALMDPDGKHWETSKTWDEPASAYAAVYPNNHVFATQSGHITEFDDTTHNERIHEYHKTGTFYEVDKAGIRTTRIVANNYTVIAGNDSVHVKGVCNLTIDSHCHTYIKGNWKVQVNGNKYETIHGNNVISVHKNQSETCNVNFTQSVGGTKGTTVTGTVSETYNSSKSEAVSSDVTETYGGDQKTTVTGDVEIKGEEIHLNK